LCAPLAAELFQSPYSLTALAHAALTNASNRALLEPNEQAKSAKSTSAEVERLNTSWRDGRISMADYIARLNRAHGLA